MTEIVHLAGPDLLSPKARTRCCGLLMDDVPLVTEEQLTGDPAKVTCPGKPEHPFVVEFQYNAADGGFYAAAFHRDGGPWIMAGTLVGLGSSIDGALAQLRGIARALIITPADPLTGDLIHPSHRRWLYDTLGGDMLDDETYSAIRNPAIAHAHGHEGPPGCARCDLARQLENAHEPWPAKGTVRNSAGDPEGTNPPAGYPLTAQCDGCGRDLVRFDSINDWRHRER